MYKGYTSIMSKYVGMRIQCTKCKDIIQSLHRHHMIWCKCESVAIDGGSEYARITGTCYEIYREEDE